MAVESGSQSSGASTGRKVKVGTNVVVATILVIAIVGVVQAIAYKIPGARWDMTSSRINSLSEATENLLRGLDADVRLTSLYFETDLEEEDQQLYRRAVDDLLGLYESTRRAKVTADGINPLIDHEQFKALVTRVRRNSKFKEELDAYQERIDRHKNELAAKMIGVVQGELEALGSLGGSMGDSGQSPAIGQIQALFTQWTSELETTGEQLDSLMALGNPQHAAAVNVIKRLYRDLSKTLKDVPRFADAELARSPEIDGAVAEYLSEAGGRFADLVADLEGEITRLQELEPLKIDDILRQLTPNANAIIVETDDDAAVVDFASIWPPLDDGRAMGRPRFRERAFKGEEKLTSAILRATHKEQTAVVFVRYGGTGLFFGGFVLGQTPVRAPYTTMKQQLEDANFIVEEWDLKNQDAPLTIDPTPTRTIYVVLKPTAPARGPMGRPSPEPPFADRHRQMLLDALGDDGRALFIAGWHPGPFGPIPANYEYSDHLKDSWGIHVDTSSLLIETVNIAPGKYVVGRQNFFAMHNPDIEVGDHAIVSGSQARLLSLPWCTPLESTDTAPEGVERTTLVTMPHRDGVWGVKNINTYQQQLTEQQFMTRAEGDLEGPFDLAIAATKGDAKIVVVSSRDFAVDDVAFAKEFALGSQGFTIRSRNPGNVALLLNSLHWLNDNTEFMNIGKPIDTAVLEIEHASTVKAIQALTIFVWPTLALVGGGVVWWTRRR